MKHVDPAFLNKIAICLASDEKYVKHLGVLLCSIMENASKSNFYDIVILANGFSLHSNYVISNITKGENISIRIVELSDIFGEKQLYERDYISKATYLRFYIPDIFSLYTKVIYIDSDAILNTDLAEIYGINLGKNLVAACRDSTMASWCNTDSDFGRQKTEYNSKYVGLESVFDYFCAGVMIFNIFEFKKAGINSDYLFEISKRREWFYQDQDVLNLVCNGRVLFLPIKWNYMAYYCVEKSNHIACNAPKYILDDYIKASEKPSIIHFAGKYQPIYKRTVHCSDVYWKYARISPFYEELLMEMLNERMALSAPAKKSQSFMKKFLKKLFPQNTKRGNFVRAIYRKIR